MTPPDEWLVRAAADAATLLCVTRGRAPALEAALAAEGRRVDWLEDPRGLGALAGLGRYDRVLVVDVLEHLPAPDGRGLLARLRDLHSHRIAAIVDLARLAGWTDAEWRSLGFAPEAEAGTLRRYGYDVVTYNPPREWNQPTHWANPRNFDRFRW